MQYDDLLHVISNPDGADLDDIRIARDVLNGLDRDNRELFAKAAFPGESLALVAVDFIRDYMTFRLFAGNARLSGAIPHALRMERSAQRVYDQLPEFARW